MNRHNNFDKKTLDYLKHKGLIPRSSNNPECKKKCYDTKELAEKALKALKRKGKNAWGVYYCFKHSAYHITSDKLKP